MKKVIDALSRNIEKVNKMRGGYVKSKYPQKPKPRLKKAPKEQPEVVISNQTIVRILIWVIAFWFVIQLFFLLQNLVILTAISLFIALALGPAIDAMEEWHIPRPLAIILLYAGFLGVLAVIFAGIIPIMGEQLGDIALNTKQFLTNYDENQIPLLATLSQTFQIDWKEFENLIASNIGQISENLQNVAGSTFGVLKEIFNGLMNFIFSMILIFFILLEKERIGVFMLQFMPHHTQNYMIDKSHIVQEKIAKWLQGRLFLMFLVGLMTYFGLKIFEYWFGMPYAFTLAIICGVMGLFPYIGVALSGVLAVLISLNLEIWYAPLLVIALISITQFIEGLLTPIVMKKVIGLSPVVVLLSLASMGVLGNHFGGVPLAIVLMILSIPLAASVSIFLEEYIEKEREKHEH